MWLVRSSEEVESRCVVHSCVVRMNGESKGGNSGNVYKYMVRIPSLRLL